MLKKTVKIFVFCAVFLTGFGVYVTTQIPHSLYCSQGENPHIASLPMVSLVPQNQTGTVAANSSGQSLCYRAKLFGVVPVKTVSVTKDDRRSVLVAGTPFGIKMFSDGAMVVGFADIATSQGYRCPAQAAGIKTGDVIVGINGITTRSNDDVERIIAQSGSAPLQITLLRDEERMTVTVLPATDVTTGSLRTGMWVRDSSAGVGTMTFYDVNKGMFAGLGHGIKDTDTQKDIRLLSGEIVPVKITGLAPSRNGQAGELKGIFTSNFATGRIMANSANGVYGNVFSVPEGSIMQVAQPQEIQVGAAQMVTTIEGSVPKKYDIVIEKISLNSTNHNKNMIIRITDRELLDKTGGIVQGMSGSPIIQNGRLVGAVTHVFVNQVTRGYAVFAQNMVESMDSAQKEYSAAG
ncbi:MAG: SpoIVB peptidase [Oscillospiraceae bacterium]|nr:SpoIVB peptidase [Oscillospiraceae bacterium]